MNRPLTSKEKRTIRIAAVGVAIYLALLYGPPVRNFFTARREAYDKLVVAALREKNVDLVCLAGYMRLLSPHFVAAFRNRILNIHPSLLPAFPGLEAQRQALEHGAKFSGCTVQFVDENLDAGPIVLQAAVPIEDGDTPESLSERILREEHRLYSEAVRIVLEGRYRIEGRRVLLKPKEN